MRRMLWLFVSLACLSVAAAPPQPTCAPTIDAPASVKPYHLVRLTVQGAPAGSAVVWVYDTDKIDAKEAGNDLVGIAPPGRYVFTAIIFSTSGSMVTACKVTAAVVVEAAAVPAPVVPPPTAPTPVPPAPATPPLKPSPMMALGMLRIGSSMCTATVIGPRRADGRWDVLTARHCWPRPGTGATLKTKDGRTLKLERMWADATADLCWMRTVDSVDGLAYAMLAESDPPAGTAIWHAGYGVDKPGNTERGSVVSGPGKNGQLNMRLSVSKGDSGGGIFREDTGELISAVCCTTSLSRPGTMWGGASTVAVKNRPK